MAAVCRMFADRSHTMIKLAGWFVLSAVALHGCTSDCDVIPNDNASISRSGLSGYVYDIRTGERIQGAQVSVEGSSLQSITDSAGRFSITLSEGTYTLAIRKDDLASQRSQPIMIGHGDSTYVALPLLPVTGGWQLSISWEGFGTYTSSFRLNPDLSVRWETDQGTLGGEWRLRGDSISIDFSNGTMLDGILADSMSGAVDQLSSSVNGSFVATR